MTDRPGRFVLLLAALAMTASLFQKGRDIPVKEDAAAFLPEGVERIDSLTIGIRGNAAKSGIYQFRGPADLDTVINMTVSPKIRAQIDKRLLSGRLSSGEIINASINDNHVVEITLENMNIKEKIALGIPLDPNRLKQSDWEELPGIGKITARCIIVDRQINGDFSSLNELKRVPGISNAKVKHLERYFKHELSR